MIITLICDVFGEENNGTTITASRLIDGLTKRGHTVRMVSTCSRPDDPNFYTVPTRSFGIFNNYVESNGVKLAKKDLKTLRRAINGSDVVHIMMPFKTGKYAIKVADELHIPVTSAFHVQPENVSTHFFMQNSKLVNDIIYRYFDKKIYTHSNFIHCPTEFIARQLDKHGYKSKKYVISNGVIPTFKKMKGPKPEELKDKFVILFSGRYSREKRHDLLIEAIQYSKYKDKIQLIFAGRGPLKNKLEKMGKNLPNPPKFVFLNKEELNKTINYCDLYVHPADVEIEAISCLECLTCGLVPVISNSKKSATKHFALHDTNLFEAGNAIDLAKKIDYWIEHPEGKEKVSEEYVEYSKQFDIDNCVDEMVEMFKDAINEYKITHQNKAHSGKNQFVKKKK